jgi:hypothetical protein
MNKPAEYQYPLADWKYEVANGDTVLGYSDWQRRKAEADWNWPAPEKCRDGCESEFNLQLVSLNGFDGIPAWVCDLCGYTKFKDP